MTEVWVVVIMVGVATVTIKALGPVIMGGRPIPARLTGVVELLAPAVLSALVVTQALAKGESLTVDARLVGLAAAAVALWRRAPILVVIVVAATATALTRVFA